MQLPTPEEVAAAKAEAAKRCGRDEVLLVRCPEPIDFCVLLQPFDLEGYCALADDQHADVSTGHRNALYRQLLWPSPDVVAAKLERRPAFAEETTRALNKRAGYLPANSTVELLADVVARSGKADPMPGFTAAAAAKLLADNANEELWAVIGPGELSVVMATPPGDIWLAARTKSTSNALGTAAKRVVQSSLDFVLQAVRWSRGSLESLLATKPAYSVDLRSAYDRIGGSGAEATTKSL